MKRVCSLMRALHEALGEELRAETSKGRPCRINRTIASGATHEQWVYGWYHCLYFDNGVLAVIQD